MGHRYVTLLRNASTKYEFALGARETEEGAVVDIHMKSKKAEGWIKSVNFKIRIEHYKKDLDELRAYADRMVKHYQSLETR